MERSKNQKFFEKIFVQPASGDAGVAYGTCLYSHLKYHKNYTFKKDYNFYLGSRSSPKEIKNFNKKKD